MVRRLTHRGIRRTGMLCVLACAPVAFADSAADAEADERLLEPPSRLAPGWFHLDFDALYVELEGRMLWREVHTAPVQRQRNEQRNRDFLFRESVGFSLHGDIVDPKLADFQANLAFGLNQVESYERFAGVENQTSDGGFLSDFDINLDLLRDQPVSANVYARRSDNRVARRFLPSLRERVTESGITVRALSGPVTTEFGLSWEDVERTGNRELVDDERLRTARFFLNGAWEISERQNLRWAYDHEHQDFTYQGSAFDFGVIRDEFRLDHDLRFGDDEQHSLSSFLRYNQESGTLARDEFVANTRLAFKLDDAWRTAFRYGFYRFDQQAIRVDSHQFDWQLFYNPNERWRFTFDGFYINEAVDQDVDTDQYGAQVDVGFNQPNDWGSLNVNLALAWDTQDISGDVGRRVIRDEAHVLEDARPVFLRERNVVAASILAHNATRTRIYVVGVDYRVVALADRVYVQRLPGGRIRFGETVYFDYRFEVPTQGEIDTYRLDLLVEHPFDCGLTPYYYFEGRRQTVDSQRGVVLRRDNQNRHRLGVRYRRPRWSVSGEFEIFDDSIEPYDAFHLLGNVSLLRDLDHTLDVRGELSHYRFEGGFDAREVWWLDLGLQDRWQIDPHLSLDSRLAYRREDDSADGITDAVDAEVAVAYRRNYLSFEFAVEYDLLSIARNRDETYGMFFRVRRDLSHLLARSGSVQ